MARWLLVLAILALAFTTINGQTVPENDDFLDSDAAEKTPEPEGVASEQPSEVTSEANDVSTQETPSENKKTDITEAPPHTEDSTINPEASTQPNLRTTVFDGSDQVYVLVPAPNPFPNLGPAPFYLRPQPPHPQYPPQPIPPFPYNHPPMMPFMPMPHPMMFPPPMPQPMMIQPGDAPSPIQPLYPQPNQPGSQVILFNQQKNPGDAVMGQSTVYLKPDGNREVIIIK